MKHFHRINPTTEVKKLNGYLVATWVGQNQDFFVSVVRKLYPDLADADLLLGQIYKAVTNMSWD